MGISKEFNIVIGDVDTNLMDRLFGPWEYGDCLIRLPDNTRWPELLKFLDIFSSTSQARKNGWNKDIPIGWTDIIIGKLRNRVYILKKDKQNV